MSQRKRLNLRELVARMGEPYAEIDLGAPVGREFGAVKNQMSKTGRPPIGACAMTNAERHAKHARKARPETIAYASALINDYETLVADLLRQRAMPDFMAEQTARDLSDRAKRRRAILNGRGKEHLA